MRAATQQPEPVGTPDSTAPTGEAWKPADLRAPIVRYLQAQSNGVGSTGDIQAAVHRAMWHRFQPSDYTPVKGHGTRWQHRVGQAGRGLRKHGVLAEPTHQGKWVLTELGKTCDPDSLPSKRKQRPLLEHAPRLSPGQGLPQRAFVDPIITALQQHGGVATTVEMRAAVHEMVKDQLEPRDFEPHVSGRPRWWDRCGQVRLKLIRKGLLSGSSPQGVWELTEAGMRHRPATHAGQNENRTPHGSTVPALPAASAGESNRASQPGTAAAEPTLTALEWRSAIVEHLRYQQVVRATRPDVQTAVRHSLGHRFQADDFDTLANGSSRWHARLDRAARWLKDVGIFADLTEHGVWALTEEALTCDPAALRNWLLTRKPAAHVPSDQTSSPTAALSSNGTRLPGADTTQDQTADADIVEPAPAVSEQRHSAASDHQPESLSQRDGTAPPVSMNYWVLVSGDVLEGLQEDAEPLTDTAVVSVLRWLLHLPVVAVPASDALGRRVRPRVKRATSEKALPTTAYRNPIIAFLQGEGGFGRRTRVHDAVRSQLRDRLKPVDFVVMNDLHERWSMRVDKARLDLVKMGLMERHSSHGWGVWQLTEEGMRYPTDGSTNVTSSVGSTAETGTRSTSLEPATAPQQQQRSPSTVAAQRAHPAEAAAVLGLSAPLPAPAVVSAAVEQSTERLALFPV